MPDHLVVAVFTSEPDTSLLPAERERPGELADGGVLRSADRYADRSKAWLVVRGDDAEAALGATKSLPLYPHMEIRDIAVVNNVARQPRVAPTEVVRDAG